MDFARRRAYYRAARSGSAPKEIAIELTPLCNQDCAFCFNRKSFFKDTRHVGQLSTDEVKEVIDGAARLGVLSIRFTGGEPLLRNDLISLMRYAKQRGLMVMLNTNATLVATKERAQTIAKYVDSVLVSLISWDAQKEEEITKMKNSLVLRLQGLDLLREAGIPIIRMGTIASPENIEHFEALYDIVKEHQVHTWEIFRPVGKSGEEQTISKEQAKLLLQKIKKLDGDVSIRVSTAIPFCVGDPEEVSKYAMGAWYDDGHLRMVVDPRGFVKPSYPNDTNLGLPHDLLAAWQHPFMQQMHSENNLPRQCRSCPYKTDCKGGNRYIAKLENGSFDAPDPLMDESFAAGTFSHP